MSRTFSQRAIEVAADLIAEIEADHEIAERMLVFHLDGSDLRISRTEAETWVMDSVDDGFPQVRWYVEEDKGDCLVVNLAAFEDPDSQYWPPSGEPVA